MPAQFEAVCHEFCDDELAFVAYFESTWVGKKGSRGHVRCNPTFPLDLWSVYSRVREGRVLTTNLAERFHSTYKDQYVAGHHPSVPSFVRSLQLQQSTSESHMAHARVGQRQGLCPAAVRRTAQQKALVDKYLLDGDAGSLVSNMALLHMKDD